MSALHSLLKPLFALALAALGYVPVTPEREVVSSEHFKLYALSSQVEESAAEGDSVGRAHLRVSQIDLTTELEFIFQLEPITTQVQRLVRLSPQNVCRSFLWREWRGGGQGETPIRGRSLMVQQGQDRADDYRSREWAGRAMRAGKLGPFETTLGLLQQARAQRGFHKRSATRFDGVEASHRPTQVIQTPIFWGLRLIQIRDQGPGGASSAWLLWDERLLGFCEAGLLGVADL